MRTPRPIARLAAAKVNLFLHVGPLGADGYHPICSLMAFADLGDRVSFAPSANMAFDIAGPFAGGLDDGAGNLVVRARDRLLDRLGDVPTAFRLTLDKRLPIAAGLGGGSADAAATLNLLVEVFGASALPADIDLEAIARELGADAPACLASRPVIAEGRGDRLSPAPHLPPLDAVLVNPGAPSSTRAVYAAFDSTAAGAGADRPGPPGAFRSPEEVAAFLRAARNDLEAPAVALQPLIGNVLSTLRAQPETLIARMSGSGATCFSICADRAAARRLAGRTATAHPTWWVRPSRLGSAGSPVAN